MYSLQRWSKSHQTWFLTHAVADKKEALKLFKRQSERFPDMGYRLVDTDSCAVIDTASKSTVSAPTRKPRTPKRTAVGGK